MDLVTLTCAVSAIIIIASSVLATIGIMLEYRRDSKYGMKQDLASIMHLVEKHEAGSSITLADIKTELDRDAAHYCREANNAAYHAKWCHVWAIIAAVVTVIVFSCGLLLDNYIQSKVNASFKEGNKKGLEFSQAIWEAAHGKEG